ncbi:MAG: hypothetical protein IJT35_08475 [Paludibacteraceae bacterium]|nr:hypothetical protein [Paludibacteraceae bacterium]
MKNTYLFVLSAVFLFFTACKEKNEPSNNQGNVSVTMQDITCTATTAHIVFNLKYTNAHIKDAGLMYGLTSQNTSDWLFATLSNSNLATIQSKTSGSYDISFDLKSLNTGYRYGVYAYAITQDDDITMTSEYNFTPSGSSSGGGNGGNTDDFNPQPVKVTAILVSSWPYESSSKETKNYYKWTDSKGNVDLFTTTKYSSRIGRASINTDSYKGDYNVSSFTYVVTKMGTGSGSSWWYYYFN